MLGPFKLFVLPTRPLQGGIYINSLGNGNKVRLGPVTTCKLAVRPAANTESLLPSARRRGSLTPPSPRAAALSSLTQGTPPSPRAGTSTMPNAKLELDEAVITPVIAELRDDANPTDYLVLGK